MGKKNHPVGRSQGGSPRSTPRGGVVVKAEGQVGPQLFVHLSRPGLNLSGAVEKKLGIPADQSVGRIRWESPAFDILQHVLNGFRIEIIRPEPGGGFKTLMRPDHLSPRILQARRQKPTGFEIEFPLHHGTIPTDPEGPLLHVRPVPADMTRIQTNHFSQEGLFGRPRGHGKSPLLATLSGSKAQIKE